MMAGQSFVQVSQRAPPSSAQIGAMQDGGVDVADGWIVSAVGDGAVQIDSDQLSSKSATELRDVRFEHADIRLVVCASGKLFLHDSEADQTQRPEGRDQDGLVDQVDEEGVPP